MKEKCKFKQALKNELEECKKNVIKGIKALREYFENKEFDDAQSIAYFIANELERIMLLENLQLIIGEKNE